MVEVPDALVQVVETRSKDCASLFVFGELICECDNTKYSRSDLNQKATAIRKAVATSSWRGRTKAFDEILDSVAGKSVYPSTYTDVKLILEQLKERDND